MALAVTLTRTVVGAVTYRLQIESGIVMFERTPIHIPLASGADPILRDLGFSTPKLIIQGVVTETSGTDGAFTIPSKEQLEDFITDSSISSTITLTLNGDIYECRISGARFEVKAAQEDRWFFTLEFSSRFRT